MEDLRDDNVHNGALVAMDYQTGELLAYVGSADYYDTRKVGKRFQPQFDVLGNGWRQPGSTVKPFNYAVGINDRTMTAATMLMDVVTDFAKDDKTVNDGNAFTPTNADGLERGPVRARPALQFSLNVPAVKALAYNRPEHVFEVARKFGMKFDVQTRPGLAFALGTAETHPVDLVTAFGTLANGGVHLGHSNILRVLDTAGNDVVEPYRPTAGEQVVTPEAAYIVTDILDGNTDPDVNPFWGKRQIDDAEGRRRPATLKTGTNNEARDLNAYGYIAPPDAAGRRRGEYALAVGAWNGNSDNSPSARRRSRSSRSRSARTSGRASSRRRPPRGPSTSSRARRP
jgi:penicillin-binding protein 1C